MFEIEHPLTGEKLHVAIKDFLAEKNWKEAVEACEKLGNGWRLPTIEELEAMYEQLHLKEKGNLKPAYYWSITEYGDENAWIFDFYHGNPNYGGNKEDLLYVRAVLTL